MVSRLVEFVLNSTDEELSTLTIEDLAVAKAWFDSLEKGDEDLKTYAEIPSIVSRWQSIATNCAPHHTEGRRQQVLLRRILNDVRLDGVERLHRNELDILIAAYRILNEMDGEQYSERLWSLLAPLYVVVESRRNSTEASPRLPVVDDLIHYVTAKDIQRSKPRSVSAFAGIDTKVQGPLYKWKGDVKVLDSVPDDTMLVVENGFCHVTGFVLGKVAATYQCEVGDNIAGMVIVSQGDIRARKIVNTAYVASKTGHVYAQETVTPTLVYAGLSIIIRDKTLGGTYAAPTIKVANTVTDGIYHVSRQIEAGLFEQTGNRDMRIVLRLRVSCDEFGGLVTQDASTLLKRIERNRRKRKTIHGIVELTQEECERYAANAVTYIRGGDHLRKYIESLNAERRRLGFLNRIIAGIDSIVFSAHEELSKEVRYEANQEEENFSAISNELLAVESEGPTEASMATQRDELLQASQKVRTIGRVGPLPSSEVKRFRDTKVQWLIERDALQTSIQEKELELQEQIAQSTLPHDSDADKSNLMIFVELLAASRKANSNETLARRCHSSFIRIMARTIETRKRRIDAYRLQLESLHNDFQDLCSKLESDHSMRVERGDIGTTNPAFAHGQFQQGVTLCTKQACENGNVDLGLCHIVSESQDRPIKFELTEDGVFETAEELC